MKDPFSWIAKIHDLDIKTVVTILAENARNAVTELIAHHETHESGGTDQINVEKLEGRLNDPQIADTLRETSGPDDLAIGVIVDGEFLKRSGLGIISGSAGAGVQGPQGPATFLVGENGEDGQPGPQGLKGETGLAGDKGLDGISGPAIFLVGEQGEEGQSGPPGLRGLDGTQGIAGVNGSPGPVIFLIGESGEDGERGATGPTGPQGPAGGGGGGSVTLVEVNLGSVASWRGKFIITDGTITGASKITIQQAPGPYTGKGTRADEAEMDPLWCVAEPGSGQATVYWRTMAGVITTYADVRGTQPVSALNTQHGDPFRAALIQKTIGQVRGNVKFLYSVAS